MFGETDKALANLHVVSNAFPDEKKYLALLASTYMEAEADDAAAEYCNKALAIDPNYPEANEILGMLAEKNNQFEQAEEYYQKTLAENVYFRNGHMRLVLLYYTQSRYDELVQEAKFMLENFDKERNSYTTKEKIKLSNTWLYLIHSRLISALIRLEDYNEAIKYIHAEINFNQTHIKDPYFFSSEERLLYKLYYLLDHKEKVAEYENRWLNHYKVSVSQINSMQEDVKQGYIEYENIDNYAVDKYDRLI
ncbi:tetratricopeptide repeat protein [Flavobacterium araucananum]|nr:tetratricopeptide repeat protein [Flavobacterium araucananum]